MRKLLTILFLSASLAYGQAGFRNGMLGLDTSFVLTASGLNNNLPVQSSLVLTAPTGNLTDTITGFSIGQGFGGLILVVNTFPGRILVIKHNSSASDSINRILTADGNDYTLPPFNTAIIGYDIVGSQWHIIRVPDVPLFSYQASPSDPTGTTSTTGVMMGLAGTFTPMKSGKLMIVISGNIANGTAGDGATATIRYGTGTAPTNGASLTGSAAGNISKIVNPLLALLVPGSGNFNCNAIVSGLSLSTAYWIDIAAARVTGGTATVSGISISVIEL